MKNDNTNNKTSSNKKHPATFLQSIKKFIQKLNPAKIIQKDNAPNSRSSNTDSNNSLSRSSKSQSQSQKPKSDASRDNQLNMDLKFSRLSFIHKIIYKAKKSSVILDQFNYWRSPILWLQIFVITFTTVYGAIFIYQKRTELPNTIPFFFFQQDVTARFIPTDSVLILMAVNIIFQFFSIYVASKTFFKFKFLSTFILINSIVSNIIFNLALFKVLRMTLY
jgi:hypothetical protein